MSPTHTASSARAAALPHAKSVPGTLAFAAWRGHPVTTRDDAVATPRAGRRA